MRVEEMNETDKAATKQSVFTTKEEIEARLAKLKPFSNPSNEKEIQHLEELLASFGAESTISEQPVVTQEPLTITEQFSVPIAVQPVTQQILPQQIPSVPVAQPAAQIMPPFRQRESQSEKNHHDYVPIVCDDATGCVTTVFKMTVDASKRLSMADYARLSQECLHTAKRNSTDIAYLYIYTAEDYGSKIRLDIGYIHASENRERKVVYVDKEACEQNQLYNELSRNGIHCFNASLSHRKISEYLYQLILSKMSDIRHELPEECGFAEIDGTWCFVTEEYCEQKGIPSVTEKSFAVELEYAVTSEQAEAQFIRFARTCHDSKQFLLLNMLRIMGLLSTPFDSCGVRFNKVVFLHGEGEQLSPYLQVYDRSCMAARPDSINVSEDRLEAYFEESKDCVVLLEDRANTSNYQKKNGVEAVNYLSNMIYDHVNSVYNDSLFVTLVFSERLSQMMQSNKALVIDYSNFSAGSDYSTSKLFALTYYLDDLIVKRVCSNYADFHNCIKQNQPYYEKKAKEYQVDPVTFTCLMLVYHEMMKQFGRLGSLVSETEMESYLAEILTASDKSYNGGSIAEEFKTRLSQMLVNGELELVRNSSMNGCYGSTGTKPILFNDDQWLYIPAETFATICEKLTLSNTIGSVRKALQSEGWLRTSEDNMTYKVTLYDNRYSGKLHVTAVTVSILSDEALKMQRGGMFNFTPCTDTDEDRILLGTDEHERNVYWSIGHDDLNNTHLLVNGRSGTGKSTTVNLIVKELFSKKQQIIYVDFSCSDTPEKLKRNGLDEDFQNEYIERYKIEEFLTDNEFLGMVLSEMGTEHKIIIFEAEKYGKPVEEFLNLLYHTITNNEALNVFLVIDEVHELDYGKGSAVYHIMEKGRSNGISLIGIFQGPHEVKPKQYTMMNQADVKLIFKQSDQSDGKAVADANGLKPPGAFTEHLLGLQKRHCLVIGNLKSGDGELMNGRFIEITVPKV